MEQRWRIRTHPSRKQRPHAGHAILWSTYRETILAWVVEKTKNANYAWKITKLSSMSGAALARKRTRVLCRGIRLACAGSGENGEFA